MVEDRELLMTVRASLLAIVAGIEKVLKIPSHASALYSRRKEAEPQK